MELFEASKSGDESRVSALIASGVAVDAQDSSRRSALHLAAWAGHLGVVKTLLRAQANVKLQGMCHSILSLSTSYLMPLSAGWFHRTPLRCVKELQSTHRSRSSCERQVLSAQQSEEREQNSLASGSIERKLRVCSSLGGQWC